MFFFNRQKKKDKIKAAAVRDAKIAESQDILLNAAMETTYLAKDVTRTMQRRMEDAVNQFIQTARIMNDALLICDPNGEITAFNPAAQKMFGLPDIPSLPVNLLFLKGEDTITPTELWALGKAKKRNIIGRHSDGSTFPVHIRASSLDRSDGKTVIMLVAQDLTLIHSSFNNSLVGCAIIINNEIVAVNGSMTRIFGYGPDELLAKKADTILNKTDRLGTLLDITSEIARIQWEGEDALLVTMRENRQCRECHKVAQETPIA